MEGQAVVDQHPRKFQHRYWVHALLFLLTLGTTTLVSGPTFFDALTYAFSLLAILSAHEFGHYYYCRKHDVDATLPYFLPVPLPPIGTFGAVIRIKEAFPSTRALFDIGVSGPIAGFIVTLPLLYWGVALSQTGPVPEDAGLLYLGEPLLFKAMAWWHFGTLPEGVDMMLHPMGFAAWFGMLATALNLLPFGQLDGGHIAYAVFGPRARYASIATLVVTILLTMQSFSWILTAAIMTLMAVFLGFRHPRVIDEGTPLDRNRLLIAAVALIIFVICFTPVPIDPFYER